MLSTLIYLIVTQAVVFVLMVIALKQLLLRDTMAAVNRLRETEAELGKKEEALRRKIDENEAEYRRKSADSQEALARAREASEKELGRMRETLVEEARKERDRILQDAERSKDKMRQELTREAEAKAIEYAGSVFDLVFSAEIGSMLNRAFLDELLAAFEEMDASSLTIETNEAELETSHPLDAAQKDRIREIVARKFNIQVGVSDKVVPGLIAGVKIKLGSLEIDGSLQNRFREAVEELKRSRM
jgi:F0F1-type ATP synthase delta subunit